MSTVIKVEHISKCYRLGLIGGGTLREDVSRWWAKMYSRPDPLLQIGIEDHSYRKEGELWALKDINFDVKQGEILGIIGGNGAGKSTLLKILSRITAPTQGEVKIKGKVGSLLEVGTGFHPELTGMENIYLSGAILGMPRKEVARKLETIIEFSEVGRFIDTPVKRYSSGMIVRLAFAVAAHLEPEILIVDEVLAVGDAVFQKKCLGKIQDVAGKGRTVLFVSHNISSINSLCNSVILLNSGEMCMRGNPSEAISVYLKDIGENLDDNFDIFKSKILEHKKQRDLPVVLEDISILNNKNKLSFLFYINDTIKIRIKYNAIKTIPSIAFGVSIKNTVGVEIVRLSTWPISGVELSNIEGRGEIELTIKKANLAGGEYFITLYCARPKIEDIWRIENIAKITIHPTDIYNSGFPVENWFGCIALEHKWSLHEAE